MPERRTLFSAVRSVPKRRRWRDDLPGWDVWPAHKGETCVSPDEHLTTYFIQPAGKRGLFRLVDFRGQKLADYATRDQVRDLLLKRHPEVTRA